jgi:diguanylate cyclase (GGDEF)-like protein
MLHKVGKSISVAAQAAYVGFVKSFRDRETIDQILGYVDPLTGMPGWKAFERDRRMIGRGNVFVLIDIDNFKSINDTFGHLYGDRVLRILAGVLCGFHSAGCKAYRLYGDEFALVVPLAELDRVCAAVRAGAKKEGTFSVSLGALPVCGTVVSDEALHLADKALYESKKRGKDRITITMPVFMQAA